jgi:hypothetical protein
MMLATVQDAYGSIGVLPARAWWRRHHHHDRWQLIAQCPTRAGRQPGSCAWKFTAIRAALVPAQLVATVLSLH